METYQYIRTRVSEPSPAGQIPLAACEPRSAAYFLSAVLKNEEYVTQTGPQRLPYLLSGFDRTNCQSLA